MMGVDTEGVVKGDLRRLADTSVRIAKDKGFEVKAEAKYLVDPKNMDVEVTLTSAGDADKFKELVQTYFGRDVLVGGGPEKFVLNYTDLALKSIKTKALEQSIEVLRNRIDQFGVSEPSITAQGTNRILVQLPGLQDATKAKDLINRTARLEFHIVSEELGGPALAEKIKEAETAANIDSKTIKYNEYVEKVNAALKGKLPAGTVVRFGKDENALTMAAGRVPYLIFEEAPVTGDLLRDARPTFGQFGEPEVAFSFKPEGAQLFGNLTEKNIRKRLAVVLDNVVYTAPSINSKITDSGVITLGGGRNSDAMLEEAKTISMALRAGALPAALEQLEERTVGPSLGKDSIQAGVFAGLVAAITIILFIFTYYQAAGLVADLALIFNIFMIIAFQTALNATLTLPGIAAIALTAGMAVDANIVIFERIRDELRSGASYKIAMHQGFDKAFWAIFDANVVAAFTAGILFYYGTGPVRGFAVSLLIGIATTMFTAIFVTKTLLELAEGKIKIKEQGA